MIWFHKLTELYKFLYCSSRCFITVYTKGFISDTAIGKQVLYFDKRNAVVDLELSKGGKVRLQYAQVDLDVGVSYDAGEEKAKIEMAQFVRNLRKS